MKLADLDKHGLNWNNIVDFCKKNMRYISAGVIAAALIVVLAVTTGSVDKRNEGSRDGKDMADDTQSRVEAFAVDAIPEINTLIQNYYTAYAAGDITAIESLAAPISDVEKSYITLMSQYISGYDNIKVYTKTGLSENEYAVSVAIDMGFEGLEAKAPGLDFFYARKDENGVYTIDNLYSQFNYQNRVQELDTQIEAFIADYETQQDVVQVCAEVQTRYEEAVAADAALKEMIDVTIPAALQTWVNQLPADTDQTDDTQTTPDDTQTTPANSIPAGTVITINDDALNIRSGMSVDTERVGTANPGEKVTVVESYAEGWTKVTWNGKTGYIKTELLLK